MKTLIKITTMTLVLILLLSLEVTAQQAITPSINSYEYRNALGLRAGETSGFTYKHKFNTGSAFEGIISASPYYNYIGFTGLFENYYNTGTPGLGLYFGGGAHINTGNSRYRYYYWNSNGEYVVVQRSNASALGLDAIFGFEYKFNAVPLAVSTDIKPFIEKNNIGDTYFSLDPSIGIKFTF